MPHPARRIRRVCNSRRIELPTVPIHVVVKKSCNMLSALLLTDDDHLDATCPWLPIRRTTYKRQSRRRISRSR